MTGLEVRIVTVPAIEVPEWLRELEREHLAIIQELLTPEAFERLWAADRASLVDAVLGRT